MKQINELLTSFFSRKAVQQLSVAGWTQTYEDTVLRIVEHPETKTNCECVDEVYRYLAHNYKDEYYFIQKIPQL